MHKMFPVSIYSGDVVTMECVDKLIRPNDMLSPITGEKLKESDIISVMRVRVLDIRTDSIEL